MVYLFSKSFPFWCHSTSLRFVPLDFPLCHLSLVNGNFLRIGGHWELVIVPSASDSVIPSCFHRFMNLNSMVISPLSPPSLLFPPAYLDVLSTLLSLELYTFQAFSFDARISLILCILYPGQETNWGSFVPPLLGFLYTSFSLCNIF